MVFSSTLKGADTGDIADQLKLHASEELAHALEVARQIDYLGGDPTVTVKDAEYSQDSKKMLEIDLKQEQETIKNYRQRIRQAERSGEFALSEALRDIIVQEQDHEIDLKDALVCDKIVNNRQDIVGIDLLLREYSGELLSLHRYEILSWMNRIMK